MADQVTNYKCPACTGPLRFDEKSGKLVCDYCGSVYEPAEIEKLYAKKDQEAANAQARAEQKENAGGQEARSAGSDAAGNAWNFSAGGGSWGAEAQNLRVYSCPSCGAELICDATTAATSCPYCGNPTIIPGQFTGGLRPEFVIPFRQDKNAAVSALKRHYGGKVFLPSAFKSGSHLEEVKGVYIPFWLFDAGAEGEASFHGTRTHVYMSGDYEITETEHYEIFRSGWLDFSKVPVDASSKTDDNFMDSIEPFAYQDLKAFSTAYLPGFYADKYDVPADECAGRAEQRCENTLVGELRGTVIGYDSVMPEGSRIRMRRGTAHYALLPVWMLTTKWNGKNYMFMMNGQTGKMVGDLPMSWGKFWGFFFGLTAILTFIFAAIGGLIF